MRDKKVSDLEIGDKINWQIGTRVIISGCGVVEKKNGELYCNNSNGSGLVRLKNADRIEITK